MTLHLDFLSIDTLNFLQVIQASNTSPEVKHENCSKLDERMKFGTKLHVGMKKSN